MLDPTVASEIDGATGKAIEALESYSAWLGDRLKTMVAKNSIGRHDYAMRRSHARVSAYIQPASVTRPA